MTGSVEEVREYLESITSNLTNILKACNVSTEALSEAEVKARVASETKEAALVGDLEKRIVALSSKLESLNKQADRTCEKTRKLRLCVDSMPVTRLNAAKVTAPPAVAPPVIDKKANKALAAALVAFSVNSENNILLMGTPLYISEIRKIIAEHPDSSATAQTEAVFKILPKEVRSELGDPGWDMAELEQKLMTRWDGCKERMEMIGAAGACMQGSDEALDNFFKRICLYAGNFADEGFEATTRFIEGLADHKVRIKILNRDPNAKADMTVFEAMVAARYAFL